MATLSVTIPSYDQPEICALHLECIMRSTRLPDEVIIVNDGGDDKLKDLLLKVDRKCRVVYAKIHEDIPWNYTGARNLAVWLSRGDFITMEDTDHLPFPNVYEEALKYLSENPKTDMLRFHTRKKVYKKDALANPIDKLTIIKPDRGTHYDLQMMRREAFLKIKGCDERFSGEYAWGCTDWRRRLDRAKIKCNKVYVSYYVILDGETTSLPRNRSKRNYSLAKQRPGEERIMSPQGILGFTYNYEIL